MDLEKMFMKVSQVARHFEVTTQSVHRWLDEGKMHSVRAFGLDLIPVEDVEKFEKERGRVR